MFRKTLLILFSVILLSACASDKKLVGTAASELTYQRAVYIRDCVTSVGPSSCSPYRAALVSAISDTGLADSIYPVGKLPAAEKKALASELEAVRTVAATVPTPAPTAGVALTSKSLKAGIAVGDVYTTAINNLLQLALSPSGQAILNRFFVDQADAALITKAIAEIQVVPMPSHK